MKKKNILAVAVFALAAAISANAQSEDRQLFNHLGMSLGVGTTGITIEAGTTITPWVQMRAGVDIMPKFSLKTSLNLEEYNVQIPNEYRGPELNEIDVKGQLKNTTGHLLFDIFPFTRKSSFHFTVGAYFGPKKIISAFNTNCEDLLQEVYDYNHRLGEYAHIPESAGQVGATLGDYFIAPDKTGHASASIRVNNFRPYVGLGFGRIVPKKRISYLLDLGVQFWGTPKVYNDNINERLTEEGAKGDDGGAIKTISKITVYPVLSIKLVGRIF